MAGPAICGCPSAAVTLEAPAHGDGLSLGNPIHRAHVPVTDQAVNTVGNVHLVGEVDEVRHLVDPYPGDRLTVIPVTHDLLHLGVSGRDHGVAPCAALDGWNARHRGGSGVLVAEGTWDLPISRVDLVAEGDGLCRARVGEKRLTKVDQNRDG